MMRHVQPLLPILLPYHLMHEQVTNQQQNEVFQLKNKKKLTIRFYHKK